MMNAVKVAASKPIDKKVVIEKPEAKPEQAPKTEPIKQEIKPKEKEEVKPIEAKSAWNKAPVHFPAD